MREKEYDVLIVGAGLGGLSCGARLSKLGYQVAIFDHHNIPGGYATNFRRKGPYIFDVSLHGVGGLGENQSFYNLLEKCGVHNKIVPIKKDYAYSIMWKGNNITIPQCPKEYFRLLVDLFPEHRAGINQLFDDLLEFFTLVREGQKEQKKGFTNNFKLSKWSRLTVLELLKEYVQDLEFTEIFSVYWSYFGLPPSQLSALYFLIPWTTYHFEGTYYIQGGAQAFSNAFAKAVRNREGKVYLNQGINKILVNEQGAAYGVQTERGEIFKGKWVVSNTAPCSTLALLSNRKFITERYQNNLNKLEIGPSITQLYLGLKDNPLDIPEDLYIMDEGDSDQNFEYIQRGDFKKVNLAITNYKRLDPTLNKAGKQSISVFFIDYIQNWPKCEKEYLIKKGKITKMIIERLEQWYPRLSDYIESIELGTPKTMHRYTRNPQGAIYGFSQTVSQSGIHRLNNRMPVQRLTLVGAWTRPGGGYQGAVLSGVTEADKINRWIGQHG